MRTTYGSTTYNLPSRFIKEIPEEYLEGKEEALEENQILIEWIRKILDTFGTMEVGNRMNVQIPIYKDVIRPSEPSPFQPQIKERIEIPN